MLHQILLFLRIFCGTNTPTSSTRLAFLSRISVLIDKKGIMRLIDEQINLKAYGSDVLEKVEVLKLNR